MVRLFCSFVVGSITWESFLGCGDGDGFNGWCWCWCERDRDGAAEGEDR